MTNIKIGTLFSGIGSPEQGAMRVYDNVDLVFACEWDKFARESFKANYNIDDKHFHKDINDMNGTQYKGKVDILIGGSPCQDFSLAGLRAGIDGNKGILIYEYIRIIQEVEPPIFIYENVKGMLSDKGGKTIKDFVQAFRDMGYYCHYEVLNTKDYGVPQNRERVFLVGFKDAEHYHRFGFADKIKLKKRLKDVLEDEVDDKYYLSDKLTKDIQVNDNDIIPIQIGNSKNRGEYFGKSGDSAFCLRASQCNGIIEPTLKQIGTYKKEIIKRANNTPKEINQFLKDNKNNLTLKEISNLTGIKKTTIDHYFRTDKSRAIPNINDWNKLKEVLKFNSKFDNLIKDTISKISTFESTSRIYSDDISPTLTCGEPSLHQIGTLDIKGNDSIKRVYSDDGISPTLTTMEGGNRHPKIQDNYKIRKLTPRECFRLQDFPDSFKFVVSNSQLYKQAGNSISVNVIEMIFRQIEKSKTESCLGGLF